MKKRFTKKQLKNWYKDEIKEIFQEEIKSYKYRTVLVCPVNTLDWFKSNDSFIEISRLGCIIQGLCKNDEGMIYGTHIQISKRKKMVIKLKKLCKDEN